MNDKPRLSVVKTLYHTNDTIVPDQLRKLAKMIEAGDIPATAAVIIFSIDSGYGIDMYCAGKFTPLEQVGLVSQALHVMNENICQEVTLPPTGPNAS